MKKLLVIFFFAAFNLTGFSQNLDSLFNVYQKLAKQKHYKQAIQVLGKLTDYWIDINPLTASQYAAMASQLAHKIHDSSLIAYSYNLMGKCYLAQKTYFMATEAFFKAYYIYMTLHDSSALGYTLLNIGKAYLKQGIADIAENKLKLAIKIFKHKNDIKGLALAYKFMGIANMKNDEQKALAYFRKSLILLDKLGDKLLQGETIQQISETFLSLGEADSSLIYAYKAKKLFEQKKLPLKIANTQIIIAQSLIQKNLLDSAQTNLLQALKVFSKYQNTEKIALTYFLLAKIKFLQKDYHKTITLAQKSIKIAQVFNYLNILSDDYKLVSAAYAKLHKWEQAYNYLSLYSQTFEQLFQLAKQQHFSSFQMNLETQNKERQIQFYKMQAEREKLLRDREMYRRNFFYILIISILITLFVIFLIARFREKIKTTHLLESTNEQLMEEIEIRKKTETELKNSEKRYRLLFRKTPVGIMQYDQNLVIIDANDKFMEIFHLPKKQANNLPLDKIFDRNVLKLFRQAIEENKEIYEDQVQILTSHGIVYVSLSIKPYTFVENDKQIKNAIVIIQDITEHKRTEQLYKQSIIRKQKLLELLPDSLILVNSKGEILEAHLPHSPDKEVGIKNLHELLPQQTISLFSNELQLAIERKKMRRFMFVSSKGTNLLARIIPDQKGNALIVISQIPELEAKSSEASLYQIDDNKLKSKQRYLQNLENIIEKELIPIYQNLQRALSFVILSNFIEKLQQIGKDFNLADIQDYAKNLQIALEDFDVPKVNELLTQFPVLINRYIGYETFSL